MTALSVKRKVLRRPRNPVSQNKRSSRKPASAVWRCRLPRTRSTHRQSPQGNSKLAPTQLSSQAAFQPQRNSQDPRGQHALKPLIFGQHSAGRLHRLHVVYPPIGTPLYPPMGRGETLPPYPPSYPLPPPPGQSETHRVVITG